MQTQTTQGKPGSIVVKTLRFGDVEVPSAERITLLRALAGFPDTKTLVMLTLADQAPFHWLQSVEQPPVAFAVLPVELVRPGYTLKLPPWDRGLWDRQSSPEILALISFQRDATMNLAAPLLLDPRHRVALQVMNQAGYGLKEPLFGEAAARPQVAATA
jgi:flagellar assembly factor FliW